MSVPAVNTWITFVHVWTIQPWKNIWHWETMFTLHLTRCAPAKTHKHASSHHLYQLRWWTSREGRQTYSRLRSWLRQKQHSHTVLNPQPPWTAESEKYRERNLERNENSVGEWHHSAVSAGKNKPKTSDHVWVDYTFATSQGNGVGGGESGRSRAGQEC